MYRLYSLHVTSCLPIQKGSTATSKAGPSSAERPSSPSGLPIRNLPAGIGIIRNVTSVPGMVSS